MPSNIGWNFARRASEIHGSPAHEGVGELDIFGFLGIVATCGRRSRLLAAMIARHYK